MARTLTRVSTLAVLAAAVLASSGCVASAGAADPAEQTRTLRYQGSSNTVIWPELAADLGYLGYLGDIEL